MSDFDMAMLSGRERRAVVLETLKNATSPVSATSFGEQFGVSRQIIVQDIALLRAEGTDILSTNRGYQLAPRPRSHRAVRIFKCQHSGAEMADELNAIVDHGAEVANVFIFHRAYGSVRADMGIRSRADVKDFLNKMASGNSRPIMVATHGYHYHTVFAESTQILDAVERSLDELGFLAPLRKYEPKSVRGAKKIV